MKKRVVSAFCALLLCAGLLTACGGNAKNEDPNSEISGYYSWQQTYQGGNKKETKNVNISGLEVTNNSGNSDVNISFQYGSMSAGIDTAKVNNLPKYTIYGLDAPYRLVVKIENITFWDYKDTYMGIEDEGIVLDVFQPNTSVKGKDNTQTVYLFIQLNGESAYQVNEKDGTLSINVKNVTQKPKEKAFYVLSPLYYEWEKMIDKVNLNPTLCADYSRYQLISEPFASQADAQAFADKAKPELQKLNLTDSLIIKEMDKGSLPELTVEDEAQLFANKNIVRVNGQEKTLPLVMAYGQFLCTSPDGSKMLFAKDVGSNQAGNSFVELYTVDKNGKATKLNAGEFQSVQKASYSADGNKLAILSLSTRSELNVYDLNTGKMVNLGEEGIGNDVASFAWDQTGNTIHVVAGDNGAYQMKTYDFSKPVGQRIKTLSERPLDQNGSFAYYGNDLYYSIQTTDEAGYEGAVYKVDKSTGTATQVTKGISFEISPNGKYMAVEDITDVEKLKSDKADAELGEGAPIEGLKVINLETGEEKRVASNVDIAHFVWTKDSSKLYYAQNQADQEEKYRYGLYSYVPGQDGSNKILDMTTEQFSATGDPNTLLVFDFVDQFFATYKMDIPSLIK